MSSDKKLDFGSRPISDVHHRDATCIVSKHLESLDSNETFRDFIQAHIVVKASGLPNYQGTRLPVPSGLHIETWRDLLQDYHDNIICDYLLYGWPLGYFSDTLPVFYIKNHRGATNYPTDVDYYLQTEIARQRIAGPFDFPPFCDGFVVSPLNTVEKRDSIERRVIVDLSWSCGHSVNDGIHKDLYLGLPIDITYPTLDLIVEAIIDFGPGCLLYKRDLRKAYRQFPVDPQDYHLLGYCWKGSFSTQF